MNEDYEWILREYNKETGEYLCATSSLNFALVWRHLQDYPPTADREYRLTYEKIEYATDPTDTLVDDIIEFRKYHKRESWQREARRPTIWDMH